MRRLMYANPGVSYRLVSSRIVSYHMQLPFLILAFQNAAVRGYLLITFTLALKKNARPQGPDDLRLSCPSWLAYRPMRRPAPPASCLSRCSRPSSFSSSSSRPYPRRRPRARACHPTPPPRRTSAERRRRRRRHRHRSVCSSGASASRAGRRSASWVSWVSFRPLRW